MCSAVKRVDICLLWQLFSIFDTLSESYTNSSTHIYRTVWRYFCRTETEYFSLPVECKHWTLYCQTELLLFLLLSIMRPVTPSQFCTYITNLHHRTKLNKTYPAHGHMLKLERVLMVCLPLYFNTYR